MVQINATFVFIRLLLLLLFFFLFKPSIGSRGTGQSTEIT